MCDKLRAARVLRSVARYIGEGQICDTIIESQALVTL